MTAAFVAGAPTNTVTERRAAASRWARRALSTDTTLIVGTRPSRVGGAGFLIEISLIDINGTIYLDSLVNPQSEIDATIVRQHHLTDEMLAGALTFDQILPDLLRLTADRTIAAYDPCVAMRTLLDDTHRAGMDPEHLGDPATWHSIAQLRSEWLGRPAHYLPLPATARTLGQCHAVLGIIRDVAVD